MKCTSKLKFNIILNVIKISQSGQEQRHKCNNKEMLMGIEYSPLKRAFPQRFVILVSITPSKCFLNLQSEQTWKQVWKGDKIKEIDKCKD